MVEYRKGDRWRLVIAFERIAEHPFAPDDEELKDIHGRDVYLRAAGRFVITYLEDFPIRRIEILAVRKTR